MRRKIIWLNTSHWIAFLSAGEGLLRSLRGNLFVAFQRFRRKNSSLKIRTTSNELAGRRTGHLKRRVPSTTLMAVTSHRNRRC